MAGRGTRNSMTRLQTGDCHPIPPFGIGGCARFAPARPPDGKGLGQSQIASPLQTDRHSLYDIAGPVGGTSYHSLQMKAEKHFASGGLLLVSHTFSKSIRNAGTYTQWLEGGAGGTGLAAVQDYSHLGAGRSLSSFDSHQRLTVSCVLDLPVDKGRQFMSGVQGPADQLISDWPED
jgi:hypothetical protein